MFRGDYLQRDFEELCFPVVSILKHEWMAYLSS